MQQIRHRIQAYAVVYVGDGQEKGQFLIGRKLQTGYFFSSAQGGGSLVPGGQHLNGGGKYALPGGEQDPAEATANAALREFQEETGVPLVQGQILHSETNQWDLPVARGQQWHYAAGYFQVSSQTLQNLLAQIPPHLAQGQQAASDVQQRKITSYADIFQRYPDCPRDNELQTVEVWSLADPATWQPIQGWQADQDLNWFLDILRRLKQDILHI